MNDKEYILALENLIGVILHRFGKCKAVSFGYNLAQAQVSYGDIHQRFHKDDAEVDADRFSPSVLSLNRQDEL
jgi:hypothetical protein